VRAMLAPLRFSAHQTAADLARPLSVDPNATDSAGVSPLMYAALGEAFHTRADATPGAPPGLDHCKVRR
jgi:hypothetical protein